MGVPPFLREYHFHPGRAWRFDFAWPVYMLAVEVEGWGRHQRRDGFERDCVKYNQAALDGWLLLRYTGRQVKDGSAARQIVDALAAAQAAAQKAPA